MPSTSLVLLWADKVMFPLFSHPLLSRTDRQAVEQRPCCSHFNQITQVGPHDDVSRLSACSLPLDIANLRFCQIVRW